MALCWFGEGGSILGPISLSGCPGAGLERFWGPEFITFSLVCVRLVFCPEGVERAELRRKNKHNHMDHKYMGHRLFGEHLEGDRLFMGLWLFSVVFPLSCL